HPAAASTHDVLHLRDVVDRCIPGVRRRLRHDRRRPGRGNDHIGPPDLQRRLQGARHGLRRGDELRVIRDHPGGVPVEHARGPPGGGVPVSTASASLTRAQAPPLKVGHLVSHVVLIAGAVAMLLPFVWMISTSLKPADQLFTVPPTWVPHPLLWDTYSKAMGAGNFGRYAMNSLFLGVANLATNVLLSALAGYAFARLRFPGRNLLFLLVLATRMVPYQVTIIPLF